jgi:cohesin loading factor subunit SCC2
VSALLLQLVQTSAHDVRLEASKIGKARQQVFALRRQDSNNDVGAEAFLDENDAEVCLSYLLAIILNVDEGFRKFVCMHLV